VVCADCRLPRDRDQLSYSSDLLVDYLINLRYILQHTTRLPIAFVSKIIDQGTRHSRPCKIFLLTTFDHYTQNLVAVCHTVWVFVGIVPKCVGVGVPSLGLGLMSDPLETRPGHVLPCRIWSFYIKRYTSVCT